VQDPQFFDKQEAVRVKEGTVKQGVVISMGKSNEKLPKPSGLNTVNFLKYCCKNLNISAHKALEIAEHLYLRGYITYPRTESTKYPDKYSFKETLTGL
jgi:DNA topoisomerase-3